MQNRDKIVSEYFELIVLLNQANPKSNQKTEIDFRIEKKSFDTLRLVAFLQGANHLLFLELCHQSRNRNWRPSDFTSFINLEQHCANFLRGKLPDKVNLPELHSLATDLKNELRSLGVTK